jgi:hypothetical protein
MIDAALDFLSEAQGRRRREITTRPVSEDVIRLIESKRSLELNFVDDTFYGDREVDAPEHLDDLAGLVVFEDLRQ